MKREHLLTANLIGLILVLFVIVVGKISYSSLITSFSESISDSQAVGIIGGTDGPTAIFVSGSFDLDTNILLLLLALLLVGILLIFNVVYFIKDR